MHTCIRKQQSMAQQDTNMIVVSKTTGHHHHHINQQRTGLLCIFLTAWYKFPQHTTVLCWPKTHNPQHVSSVSVGWFHEKLLHVLHFLFFFGLGSHVYSSCVRVSFKNSNDEVRNSHLILFLSAGCWNNCRVFCLRVRNLLILKFSCLLSLFFLLESVKASLASLFPVWVFHLLTLFRE